MKQLFIILLSALTFYACGEGQSSGSDQPEQKPMDVSEYDPHRGEGKFESVELGATLDAAMATEGKQVYEVKCASCHKLSDERLVGPGWAGVTERRRPEWIMNFITNPDAMLDQDPELQAQLEICLVRMPNQNLADAEARSLLEFMRQNDGVK